MERKRWSGRPGSNRRRPAWEGRGAGERRRERVMKTPLPQGFSRLLLSFTTCGYLPSSRQNSLNLATHYPQGCPGNLRGSLRQEDGRKSRSADGRERSTRRERARVGLVPLPCSCEVWSALVRATQTPGLDRIRIIPISARRMTSDRRRRDHGSVVFLRGEARFSVTIARSQQSSRLHGERQHPYRFQTSTTQATEYPVHRQRCRRVTRSPERQSVNSLRRETLSNCLTLVTPPSLPRHCCLTRRRNALVQHAASALERANATVLRRRTRPRLPKYRKTRSSKRSRTRRGDPFSIQCVSKWTT
jgi:hypothetical protein